MPGGLQVTLYYYLYNSRTYLHRYWVSIWLLRFPRPGCTSEICITKMTFPGLNIVFVDTPGFDNTKRSDSGFLVTIFHILSCMRVASLGGLSDNALIQLVAGNLSPLQLGIKILVDETRTSKRALSPKFLGGGRNFKLRNRDVQTS